MRGGEGNSNGAQNNHNSGNGGQKIGNILSDYEKNKIFNKEVMKNIGSPKGPLFTRINL